MTNKVWSRQDCDRLVALKQQRNPRLSTAEIAVLFDVSVKAVNTKYIKLLNKVAGKPERRRQRGRPPGDPATQPAYERNGARWTENENMDLVRRVAAGELYPAIGRALNRTAWACKAQYAILKRWGTAEFTPADMARRATREALEVALKQLRDHPLRPQSITAWICGDPLPGRSALDLLRAGRTGETFVDRRAAGTPVTLPMEPFR